MKNLSADILRKQALGGWTRVKPAGLCTHFSEAPDQITGFYSAQDSAGSCAKFIDKHLSLSSPTETNTGTIHRRWRDRPNQRSLASYQITIWLFLDHPSLGSYYPCRHFGHFLPSSESFTLLRQMKNARKSQALKTLKPGKLERQEEISTLALLFLTGAMGLSFLLLDT